MLKLYKYQEQAVTDLCNGKRICCIGTGCGKTAVMFNWLKRTGAKDIIVVTTATKAKSGDMQKEAVMWNGEDWVASLSSFVVVSWHGLSKLYANTKSSKLKDIAIAFDEVAKCKGYNTGMGSAFRSFCKGCKTWSGYTATPGDTWKDFMTYFVATKKFTCKTDFMNKHTITNNFRGFPEIVAYKDEEKLEQYWSEIATTPDTSQMFKELPPETHKVIEFKTPKNYKKIKKERTKEDGEFIESTMGLCHYLRQICFTKEKQEWLSDFIEGLGTNCVFFCNYVEEEEILCDIAKKVLPKGSKIWRIDGKHHDVPTADTIGKYDIVVAHYASGGEALNLQFMHYWCSVSPNYSYSVSIQARGRIKRIGQKHNMFYYYLKSTGTIEEDIYTCLKDKSDFSEKVWIAKLDNEEL